MARQTWVEGQIPEKGADGVPYKDNRELVNGALRHMGELFIAQGTGADGAGFDVEDIPFEPAYVELINQGGASPAFHKSVFTPTEAHISVTDTGAGTTDLSVPGTAPSITKVADRDWTLTVPTGIAPDTEVVTCIIYGARDVAGGL